MPFSNCYNALFVHVPKTAGTSIEEALGVYGKEECLHGERDGRYMQHYSAYRLKVLLGEERWSSAFKFSFVRNPWDRIVSEYHYLKKMDDSFVQGVDFDQFVRSIPEGKSHKWDYLRSHFRPQSDLILIDNQVELDFVGRYESLSKDWHHVRSRLGPTLPQLPHKNRSGHRHYSEYYTKDSKTLVEKEYRPDIEFFSYEF